MSSRYLLEGKSLPRRSNADWAALVWSASAFTVDATGVSGYRLSLRGSYAPRDVCVQYDEPDWAFLSRLMEEDGIFYFVEHRGRTMRACMSARACAEGLCRAAVRAFSALWPEALSVCIARIRVRSVGTPGYL